ncbi:uncharacterized protein LOC134949898 [Pseudophryne corroboree]|uniref:uncharacterized protein LOC134949898 n=1 Tax=Pseudophryne corroboree TaxID=495146 RepID=UPI003081E721
MMGTGPVSYMQSIPHRSPIHGGLRPGMSIYIQGSIPKNVNRFHVNFSCGADTAFHFNPRFGEKAVVFNTSQSGSWGSEERKKDGFPFHKGNHFELVFLVNLSGFQVSVNGSAFYEYRHRIPVQRVDSLLVDGDVSLHSVTIVGGGAPMTAPSFPSGGAPMPGYPSMNLPVMGGPVYNPPVPYFGNIPGGVSPKRTFVVRGFIPQGGKRFHINFNTSSGDTALHFNVRINENVVVRNSKLGGAWGSEERQTSFNPFVQGQYFDVSVRSGNGRFKIFVNGQPFCEYVHRFQNLPFINTLEVAGDVVLSLVQGRGKDDAIQCELRHQLHGLPTSLETADMAFVPAMGYQPVYNPSIPHRSPIHGGLQLGMSVYIQGSIPHHINRFHVNFCCGQQYNGTDIAFHFNPRFDGKNKVVFNTFQSGSWGSEEKKKDGFPFHKGGHFELVFLVNLSGFQVNVNGSPFYEYRHRIPIQRVDSLIVDGDVSLRSVTIVGGGGPVTAPSFPPGGGSIIAPAYPPGGAVPLPGYPPMNLPVMGGPVYNPPVPYFGNIPGGVSPKRTFVVRGFIPQGGSRFHVNFNTSSGETALHLGVRIHENAVVRNSKLGGAWGPEERHMSFNPFIQGQYFDISIRCGNGRYKIFVNGQQFCDYVHRFQHLQIINTLEIAGDVVLSLVQF